MVEWCIGFHTHSLTTWAQWASNGSYVGTFWYCKHSEPLNNKKLQLVYGVWAPRVVTSMATTMEVYMLSKDCTWAYHVDCTCVADNSINHMQTNMKHGSTYSTAFCNWLTLCYGWCRLPSKQLILNNYSSLSLTLYPPWLSVTLPSLLWSCCFIDTFLDAIIIIPEWNLCMLTSFHWMLKFWSIKALYLLVFVCVGI